MTESGDRGATPRAGAPARKRRAWVPAVLAAGVVLGLWGPNLVRPPPPAWTAYVAIKGQIRRVKLADHSLLRLNGATAVRVVFEDRARRAVFEGGEAEFNLSANARPFLIAVGDRQARTQSAADFDLRRYGDQAPISATLTVRRGQVVVGRDGDPPRTLGPGDQMSWVNGRPAPPTRKVDPETAFAWESHRLIYRQAPLREVVADLNRYVDRPIVLAQPSVGELPFTGVLALDTEDRMLKRIEAALPVQAQPLAATILLKARPRSLSSS